MIDAARTLLRNAGRIVSFSGAGLSAESGVATFRDAQEGLWSQYDPIKLASPDGFADNPELVIDWYAMRRRQLAKAQPNPAHIALARRCDIIHVTQNVDDLLERAGARDVQHLHGRLGLDRCHARCGFEEHVHLSDPPSLRACPTCGGQLRPGVVWFGETLPSDVWDASSAAVLNCEVLLVVGTSAVVHPAAGLIQIARQNNAHIIVVNLEASEASHMATIELIGQAGEIVPQLI